MLDGRHFRRFATVQGIGTGEVCILEKEVASCKAQKGKERRARKHLVNADVELKSVLSARHLLG